MLTAQDTSYDEARNLHSKWQKHQAFMAELASNKDWLHNIDKVYSNFICTLIKHSSWVSKEKKKKRKTSNFHTGNIFTITFNHLKTDLP